MNTDLLQRNDAEVASAFQGKKVFVTGHTGFKGSWLVIWLHQLGAKVTGYSLPPATNPNNFEASDVERLLEAHYEGDIRDGRKLQLCLDVAKPDFIFHLAAQPLVRKSYNHPRETWEVNVIGTSVLLDAVLACKRPCVIVVVTSDKCYENRGQPWGYRECDPIGGFDPYSASKGACELLVSSYRHSFFPPDKIKDHGIKIASARAGNAIGGGDWAPDRIITDIVTHLSQGLPVPVRNPRAVRPWQHVLEPLSGYLLLAARMQSSNEVRWCTGWNFGPALGGERTVSELVEQFCRDWGDSRWKDVSSPLQWYEGGILRLSIDKARWELGWSPRWDFKESVRRTACW